MNLRHEQAGDDPAFFDTLELFKPELPKFVPHEPFPKQTAFLMLPHTEALYGGALGGGKSDALLMNALQYVWVPGYSALLLRKTLTDLKQSGALLDRMLNWLQPFMATKEVKYEASTHKFRFPTYDTEGNRMVDATIQFGYIGDSNAFTRYQGIEIQFCAFDELTQHALRDYEYLFTRLRKCVCPVHTERDENQDPVYVDGCQLCTWAKAVPIKMRGTCNPDGVGFQWVKDRFSIEPNMTEDEADQRGVKVKWIGKNNERPFMPASFVDNPYLDHKAYEKRLREQLSDDLYTALVEGSWGVLANARFKRRWQRYYSWHNRYLVLGPNGKGRWLDLNSDVQTVFMTLDPATSLDRGPGDIEIFNTRVKNPSYTVISTWMLTTCYNLIWLHMARFREEIPEVVAALKELYEQWKPDVVLVEENGVGKGVSQYASRMGMEVKGIHKERDKLVDATNAIVQMEKGRIWFPQTASWLKEAEDEVFSWQGYPQENDDIIDTLAHAANHVKWEAASDPEDYFYRQFEVKSPCQLPNAYKSKFIYTTF